MAPRFLAYIDKHGRPLPTVILQLLVGLLAFINESPSGGTIFTWLLALSGLANFLVYGSICLAHIRFRAAWRLRGHSTAELPYRAAFGVVGSYIGMALCGICLVAQFYTAMWPIGGSPDAEAFFSSYLAAPLAIALYAVWKVYSWFRIPENMLLWVPLSKIDVYMGMRDDQRSGSVVAMQREEDEAMKKRRSMGRKVYDWFF